MAVRARKTGVESTLHINCVHETVKVEEWRNVMREYIIDELLKD